MKIPSSFWFRGLYGRIAFTGGASDDSFLRFHRQIAGLSVANDDSFLQFIERKIFSGAIIDVSFLRFQIAGISGAIDKPLGVQIARSSLARGRSFSEFALKYMDGRS